MKSNSEVRFVLLIAVAMLWVVAPTTEVGILVGMAFLSGMFFLAKKDWKNVRAYIKEG